MIFESLSSTTKLTLLLPSFCCILPPNSSTSKPTTTVPRNLFLLSTTPVPAGITQMPLGFPKVGNETCKDQGFCGELMVYCLVDILGGFLRIPNLLFTVCKLFALTQSKDVQESS